MNTWITMIDKYGITIVCLIAVGMFIAKFIYDVRKDDKENRESEKTYFVKEIDNQRKVFTDAINTQNKTFTETVDKFNTQLTKLSDGLIINNEKLQNVEGELEKVVGDVNEIKYTLKARD